MVDRPNIDRYKEILNKRFRINIDQKTKTHYDFTTTKLKKNIEESEIWQQIIKNWKDYNDSYYSQYDYNLFIDPDKPPEICIKEYEKFFEKTYRKNILYKPDWEKEPDDAWILPKNWYSKINDIIRTTILVKYIDGVKFIIDRIIGICENHGIHGIKPEYKASEEGYYAVHIYVPFEYDIPDFRWRSRTQTVYFEIQITTQLQEVMKKLLHNYYEKKRLKNIEDLKRIPEEQWNYKSEEFAPSYLGHILHYIEGMIMEIREKQTKKP